MKRWNGYPLHTLFTGAAAIEDPCEPDAMLVERFAQGDPAAFELLLRRHAKGVFGTCSRVCRDLHDAEDAFQATFLILARKATSLRHVSCLAGWLHRVAHRAATRAAVQRARMQRLEQVLAVDPLARPRTEEGSELHALLDAEINRLADRYRLPVILCYLQGLSTDAAATRLGIPRGTVLSRLATARQKLTARLSRRGVTASATAAALAGVGVQSAVSAALLRATARSALDPSTTPIRAGLLAWEILHMTTRKKILAWVLVLASLAGLAGGIRALTAGGQGEPMPAGTHDRSTNEKQPQSPDHRPREAAQADAGQVKGDGKAAEAAQQEKEERAKEKRREQEKEATIDRLEAAARELEDKARKYREMMHTLGIPRNVELDEKVLVEAIIAVDRHQLVVEMDESMPKEVRQNKLATLNARRQELMMRLLRQQQEKSQQTREREHLERELARYDRQVDELRDHLFHLRFDLGPRQSALSIEQSLGQLLEEVAALKKEVRKLTEEKK
jgi:RNA polymerase sigma factor (sigma-70 family)